MSPLVIQVRVLPGRPELPLPERQSVGASGMDVVAAEALVLDPGAYAAVGTGLALAIPVGFEVQVRPRSGLAAKHGVTVLNSPGTIDADYRGELKVLLVNHGKTPYNVQVGDRIAQLVVSTVVDAVLKRVETLGSTERGEGGFGSTGR
ncbi:MAG: dUTP diphosphatase [Myxococcota bacterium]